MTWPTMSEGAEAALTRAGGRCERCGQQEGHDMTGRLVVHHVAGRGFAACNHPALLLVAHDRCHRLIHDRPADSYRDGSMLHRNGIERVRAVAYLSEHPDDHRPIRETEAWN